ncbi:MAG: hypothetical protein NAOJABEB_02710 [Steroidobacteraceae bacterium]|nr:hypothetical protein [Steroidobacteraceae bacterium]
MRPRDRDLQRAGRAVPRARVAVLCGLLTVAACSGPAEPSLVPGSEAAATTQPEDDERAADLPLRRGFYVSNDTACGEASNATLALLHAAGLNSAREDCHFDTVVPLGGARYRTTEHCAVIGTGDMIGYATDWEVLSDRDFRRTLASGAVIRMRRCEQSSLPEAWRMIDLDAAINREGVTPSPR